MDVLNHDHGNKGSVVSKKNHKHVDNTPFFVLEAKNQSKTN